VIEISYVLRSPVAGIRILKANDKLFAVTEASHEATRLWLPSKSDLHSTYPINIQYAVPADDYVCVSSGELQEILEDDTWRYYRYTITDMFIDTIGFAVGKFGILCDQHLSYVTHFSVNKDLKHTVLSQLTTA
jgi:hypothetical protein